MEGALWDTFKACLRGITRSTISYIKRTNRQEEEELAERCAQAEAEFVNNPSNIKQIRWAGLAHQYKNQLSVNAKCKRLKQKPKNFEQGHQLNRILNYLIKQQTASLVISEVRNERGEMVNTAEEILMRFHRYYVNMYSSTLTCNGEEIEKYLENLEFFKLTEEQKEGL